MKSPTAVMNFREGLIDTGLPLPKVDAQVKCYAAKKLIERSRLIAKTEVLDSMNRAMPPAPSGARIS